MTGVDAVLLVVLAVLLVVGLLSLLDSGEECTACRWSENHCAESRHYAKRPCCDWCSHKRLEVVDRNPEP